MKKRKPVIVFLVLILIPVLCFSGYRYIANDRNSLEKEGKNAADSGTKSPAQATDRLEISVALWKLQDVLTDTGKDQFYRHLSDKFNLTIRSVPITWDDYMEKIQIWAASNQLPDIFSADAIGTRNYWNWINRELLKALPDDLSTYPRLSEYLELHEARSMKYREKLYCIPRGLYDSLRYCAHDRNVFYRWDLAEKAGIREEPETWEEFRYMLREIVSKDPENTGIAGLTTVNIKHIGGFLWIYSNPAATSDGSGNDYKWIKEDGRYIPAVFSKNALPSLVNARNMYREGLIDKDITMIKGSQAYEKFAAGKAAAVLMVGYGNLDTMINSLWKNNYPGKNLMDCVKRANYFPSIDGIRYQSTFKTYWSESYFSAQVDENKMDRILSLYEYMLTPEAKKFYRFGAENADYTEEGDEITPLTKPEALDKKQRSASVLGSLVEFDNKFQYDKNNYKMDPEIKKAAVENLERAIRTTRIPDYEPELTCLSTPAKDMFSIFDYEDLVRVMLGTEPVEKMWREILEDYEEKGLSKMISEVNRKAEEMGLE